MNIGNSQDLQEKRFRLLQWVYEQTGGLDNVIVELEEDRMKFGWDLAEMERHRHTVRGSRAALGVAAASGVRLRPVPRQSVRAAAGADRPAASLLQAGESANPALRPLVQALRPHPACRPAHRLRRLHDRGG